MTIDDRSLREHLDRRAEAGASGVDGIAEAVVAQVARSGDGGRPWWRPLNLRRPSLGIAVAAIVVVVVAVAVLPSRLPPGPGTSPSPSASSAPAPYPARQAMTAQELDAFLGPEPSQRAGDLVIADVELRIQSVLLCPFGEECPRYLIDVGGREIYVLASDPPDSLLPGPYAFRVADHPGGRLRLLGSVRSGPDGLAWTLPPLTAALVDLKGPGARPVPYLYLVDAVRVISPEAFSCPPDTSSFYPPFSCGSRAAWLIAPDAPLPTVFAAAPPASLRLPSAVDPAEQGATRGFYLLNPFVADTGCALCPEAGAADLVGRVLPFDELELAPSETNGPAAAQPYPTDRALNVLELDAVLGSDPAARAGVIVIADVTFEMLDVLCLDTCPRYLAVLENRQVAVYDPGDWQPELAGPSVLRIRDDGALDFLGRVRTRPDGLAWTLPQLTAELTTLRGPGVDAVPYLYLVEGWHAVAPFEPTCAPATGDPRFGCGDLEAWLVPDEATVRGLSTGLVSTPDAGIRVPNGGQSGDAQAGFWLVDPWVDQSGCTRCPAGGAADLFGRILSLEELGVSP
ncbi:MAG: hypothetical protein EPO36_09675 [Chloroflexota bacterium]|nr:MAG: hypothetical protein EPO36_09675 [Chloroflexota bacterium]